MRRWAFETDDRDAEFGDNDAQLLHAVAVAAVSAPAAPDASAVDAVAVAEAAPETVLPPAIDAEEPDLAQATPDLSEVQAAPAGLVTSDGIEIAQILRDRPDVFAAFFTEYYGAGNDRHSDAWANRVGGATVEDYANYWYETYGKYGVYQPSTPSSPSDPDPAPEPVPTEPEDTAPPEIVDLGEPLGDAALTVGQGLADPSQSVFG